MRNNLSADKNICDRHAPFIIPNASINELCIRLNVRMLVVAARDLHAGSRVINDRRVT